MIPDRNFISHCIFDLGIDAPDEVIRWFLAHYEDEPYEDFFDEDCLIELFRLATDAYWSDSLDTKVPSKCKRLKERVAAYKDLIADFRVDIDYLEEENFRLREFLSEHGLLQEALSYTRKP